MRGPVVSAYKGRFAFIYSVGMDMSTSTFAFKTLCRREALLMTVYNSSKA